MVRLLPVAVPITLAVLAATSFALPPGAAERGLRDGANHRAGDDSFVATHGRTPDRSDGETLRMRAHLQYIRAQLAAKPATRPELAARRTQLLGYLDDYIVKGTTPVNTRLPWRTPVFIDDFGNICAVGYLIERSVGRELPDRIAKGHRFDFLEDIAAALPEVRAWIDSSGLTLEELASIQPGYAEPEVESWTRWEMATKDGPYRDELENGVTVGTFRKGKMEGTWTRRDSHGVIVGTGELVRGRGTWHSVYPDGKRMAEGPFVANHPHGSWTFFHPSGNVAAEGRFARGHRDGTWKFFYDTKAKTPIAIGPFARGSQYGNWKHYDAAGKLLARSNETRSDTRDKWETQRLLVVVPGADKVQHEFHSYAGMDSTILHGLYRGGERLYFDYARLFDAEGYSLAKVAGGWQASDCRWTEKRKRIARNGDVSTLHRLIRREQVTGCVDPKPVPAERGKQIDSLLATMTSREKSPAFVKELVIAQLDFVNGPVAPGENVEDPDEDEAAPLGSADRDLVDVIATGMGWYVEWPHIDGRFIQVFHTLPGQAQSETWARVKHEQELDAQDAAAAAKTTKAAN